MLAQIHYIPGAVRAWLDDARWWLRNPAYSNPRRKVGTRTLPEVVDALRVLYDEETCRNMIDLGYWVPLLGLFHGAPFEWFGVMLALGVDLADANAIGASWLANRLRAAGDQWLGARLELGVFAGLTRHLFAPSRPNLPRDSKQWDFTLDVDGAAHVIECKTLSTGNDDGNFGYVTQRFENFAVEFGMEPRCNATFAISDELRDLMHRLQVQSFYESIIPELTDELRHALTLSEIDGVQCPAGRFGTVARTLTSRGDSLLKWNVTGYGGTTFHRQRRLVHSFANATANFEYAPAGSHRTAIVWLGKDYLDCASSAKLISDNFDRSISEDNLSVSVDAARFGYETGIALGVSRPFDALSWMHDRGIFHVGASQSRSAYRVYDAVSAWRYHIEPC